MNRKKINLVGGGFQHSPSTSGYNPLHVEWVKNSFISDISIYVDYGVKTETNKDTKNYAWICESRTIIPDLYEWCRNNINYLKNNFIYVFTHDIELSKVSDIFKIVQCSGKSFIKNGKMYDKTKLVSMIASNKIMCEEHRYRQEIIKKYSNKCDHYGRGYNEITNKEDGLIEYCFSFVIENATYSNMFTEKITDCFMTGTIPIYYGMNNIGDFFNLDGIIILNENFKVEDLSFDLYYSKIKSVKENLQKSENLLVAEDYIYLNYIKNEI